VGLAAASSGGACTTVLVRVPAAPVPSRMAAVMPPPSRPAQNMGRNPFFTPKDCPITVNVK
jgi:hypothetical protein